MLRPMRKIFDCAVLGVFLCGVSSAEERDKDQEKEKKDEAPPADRPPFKDLLLFNGEEIFGGKLALEGDDRFEVTFHKAGQMAKGFEGQGIMDDKSPGAQGTNRKFFTKDKDQVIENLAAIGIAPPTNAFTLWTARFPVAGDVRVKFDFRIPNLLTQQSIFFARINWTKEIYLETQFFNSVTKNAYGKIIAGAKTPLKEYSGPPSKWFPRKDGKEVPVEISVEDGKLKVNFAGKDIVALDKVNDASKGKVAFGFRKIAFTIQNLKISGKLDKAWCEAELSRLEKAGKLVLKAPQKEEPSAGAPPPEEKRRRGEGKKTEKKEKDRDDEGDL